jgi:long-chain acyl-CoA synthetase
MTSLAGIPHARSYELLREIAERSGARRAAGCDGHWMTFAEWWEESEALARRLEASGETGRPVGLLFQPGQALAFLKAYVGCHMARCPTVPLNSRLTRVEHDYQLREAGVRRILTADGDALLPLVGESKPLHDRSGNPLADIIFTSGTTGAPKGVMVGHRLLAHFADVTTRYVYTGRRTGPPASVLERDVDEEDTIFTSFPVYSTMSLTGVINIALLTASTQYFLSRFDGGTFSREMVESGATISVCAPSILALWRQAEPTAEAMARSYVTAGAPVATDLASWVLDALGDRGHLISWYGLTEGGGDLVALDEELARESGAIGIPVPGSECRIVDEAGRDADKGELIFRMREEAVMEGYLNLPDLTKTVMQGEWFYTGDVVEIRDGIYCLLGRHQEWINRGGYKIAPTEIENLVLKADGVIDAAAVPIPHDVLGEDVALCIEIGTGASSEVVVDDVRALLESIADFKRPRRIICVDFLPRNVSGKVVRSEVKRLFAEEPR